VASECLFSTAGDIYDEKRNRLAPEQAEVLMFVKKNFSLVGGTISTDNLLLLLLQLSLSVCFIFVLSIYMHL